MSNPNEQEVRKGPKIEFIKGKGEESQSGQCQSTCCKIGPESVKGDKEREAAVRVRVTSHGGFGSRNDKVQGFGERGLREIRRITSKERETKRV
jgi:hypothetical protein